MFTTGSYYRIYNPPFVAKTIEHHAIGTKVMPGRKWLYWGREATPVPCHTKSATWEEHIVGCVPTDSIDTSVIRQTEYENNINASRQ